MKITLKSYSDLGRCSLGTLLEVFDTDTFDLYDYDKPVKVRSVEDLFPYLWRNAGVSGHANGRLFAYFYGTDTTHWHQDFDKSVKNYKLDLLKLKKKLAKAEKPSLVAKYEREIQWDEERIESLTKMLARLDEEMEEQKLKLIEENQ